MLASNLVLEASDPEEVLMWLSSRGRGKAVVEVEGPEVPAAMAEGAWPALAAEAEGRCQGMSTS